MSQTYTADCFAAGHVAQTDLQNMEDNFAALKSCFSGDATPANTVPGMLWFDTDTPGAKAVLKQRDEADAAWIGIMHGDASQKIWVYRNAAMDGWVVDSSVTDKVLALKGGATYTAGAASAGSWTLSGLTFPNHVHNFATSSGTINYGTSEKVWTSGGLVYTTISGTENTGNVLNDNTATDGGGSVSSDASWRAAAAVGTLQYLDL